MWQGLTIREEHQAVADRCDLQVLDPGSDELIDECLRKPETRDINSDGAEQRRRDAEDAGVALRVNVDNEAR